MRLAACKTPGGIRGTPATDRPDDEARRVLFLVDTLGTFEQQRLMARAIEESGRWESWFAALDGAALPDGTEGTRFCSLSINGKLQDVRGPMVAALGQRAWSSTRTRVAAVIHSRAMTVPRELRLALYLARTWHCQRKTARARLAQLSIRCVITAQERSDAALPVVAAAHDMAIPVILVPAAGLFMPDGGAYMRRGDSAVKLDPDTASGGPTDWGQILLNRLIAKLQPGHVVTSRWGRMLHRPAHWYLASWFAGMSLRSAWYQGTRFVDAVAISGDDERRVCRAAEIPDRMIAAIGSPALQIQYERMLDRRAIRAQVETRYALPTGRPLVIFAIPVLWEHRMIGREEQFTFVKSVLGLLANQQCSVLLSLHPKMKRDDYQSYATAAGVKIADSPLSNFLPAADAFIAGGYSSTIRWALAVGIPAVNLDLWDLNESTYAERYDYPTLRSLEELTSWLSERIDRPAIPLRSASGTLPLGMICDGRFGEHFVELVDNLTAAKRR